MAKSKAVPTRIIDVIGQELAVGDCVVVEAQYGLVVAKITRFTPKMVVVDLGVKEATEYATSMVKLTSEQATWYFLTQGSSH